MPSFIRIFFISSLCLIGIFFLWEMIFVAMQKNIKTPVNDQVRYILLYEIPEWMKTVKLVPAERKCVMTSDRKYLPKLEMFDALLFSGQNNWSVDISFPKVRSPHQYYVFVDLECPLMSFHKFSPDPTQEIYNLTMTYRRDSDVYWPYGFITNQDLKYLSEAEEPTWMSPIFESADADLLERIGKKNKTAAWFVSNCHGKSRRNYLAKALQNVIDVDIYGKCGTLECPRSRTEECYDLVDLEYFFYLSFENSLCKDYLTEKVFNIMRYHVVPVVFGRANYSQYLPPYSYIDADDYANSTELGTYLKFLTTNTKEYAKYFWWKKHYKTIVSGKTYNNLCDKLHDLTSDESEWQPKSYSNIEDWWEKDQCTMYSKKIKFL